MFTSKILASLFLTALVVSGSVFAHELGRTVSESHKLQFIVSTDDANSNFPSKGGARYSHNHPGLLVNGLMSLKVSCLDKDAKPVSKIKVALINLDARMPEHNHGMIVKPLIIETGPYEWKVNGFKLHMDGYWEISLVVKIDDKEETVKFALQV